MLLNLSLIIIIFILEISLFPSNDAYIHRYRSKDRLLNINSLGTDVNDANLIDPLDNIKGKVVDIPMKYRVIQSSNSSIVSAAPIPPPSASLSSVPSGKYELRRESSLLLQESESQILKSLPVKLLVIFQEWLNNVSLRMAFIMTTVYFMLVVPIVPYAVSHFHASIVGYLYIGPILFPLPFLYCWCWINNLFESNILDSALMKLLSGLRDTARENLPELERDYTQYLNSSSETNSQTVEDYAYTKIVADIDVNAMFDEMKYVMRERTDPSQSTPISAANLASMSSGNIFSAAKYLGDVAMSIDSTNTSSISGDSSQVLLDLQSKIAGDDERELTMKAISVIESVFNKTDSTLQRLKDIASRKKIDKNNE